MSKEKQPDLFPGPESSEEAKNEPSVPTEISEEIQAARRKRYADKKIADQAFEAGRRKIMGETKDGQQEAFRE